MIFRHDWAMAWSWFIMGIITVRHWFKQWISPSGDYDDFHPPRFIRLDAWDWEDLGTTVAVCPCTEVQLSWWISNGQAVARRSFAPYPQWTWSAPQEATRAKVRRCILWTDLIRKIRYLCQKCFIFNLHLATAVSHPARDRNTARTPRVGILHGRSTWSNGTSHSVSRAPSTLVCNDALLGFLLLAGWRGLLENQFLQLSTIFCSGFSRPNLRRSRSGRRHFPQPAMVAKSPRPPWWCFKLYSSSGSEASQISGAGKLGNARDVCTLCTQLQRFHWWFQGNKTDFHLWSSVKSVKQRTVSALEKKGYDWDGHWDVLPLDHPLGNRWSDWKKELM